MQQISRMHVFQALEHLVYDILFVDVFKNVCPNDCMQVSIHEVKNQVNISVILSSNHVLEPNYVFMACQLLQENDLTESTLSVCCILKGIKVLFKRNNLLGPLVDSLPDYTISSLTCTQNWKVLVKKFKFCHSFFRFIQEIIPSEEL